MKKALIGTLACWLIMGFVATDTLVAQDPMAEFEAKMEETDFTDADAVFDLAKWAIANKKSSKVRKEGRRLMKEVLDLDEDHEGAREALGYRRLGDKWLTKKQYQKEIKKVRSKEMKEKGYVAFKGGWIKAKDKRKYNSRWKKNDEDIWVSFEDQQRAKGLVNYKGTWLGLNAEDRKRMEHHREMTGDDILVASSQHFRLHMGIKPSEVKRYQELAEKVYDWYCEEFKLPQPPEAMLWPGQSDIWHFETQQEFHDWITTYSEVYNFSDEDKKRMREQPGGRYDPGRRLICVIEKRAADIENGMVHGIGQQMQVWHTRGMGGAAAWLNEAFGHLAEQEHSQIGFGNTNCSTRSRYADGGGVADKEYNTKDGKHTCKSIVKAGDELPILELSKLNLNALNGENLSQGFGIVEWLYQTNREGLIKMLNAIRTVPAAGGRPDGPTAIEHGITKGLGMSIQDFEKAWRSWVKKKYKTS